MAQIYVYVDGSDLEDVEGSLIEKLEHFSLMWGVDSVRVVNDRFPRTPDLAPEDLPDWNIGLNFEVKSLSPAELRKLIDFLSHTSAQTGRDFVIGIWHPSKWISEDWCFVGPEPKESCITFLAERFQ